MTGSGDHTTSPPAAAPNIPQFTLGDLHERLDGVLSEGITGTVYSLRGYPGLAVKEVLLDGLDRRSVDAIRLELAALPGLSHPGILRYHQVVEDEGLIYIVTDRHDKTLERLLTEHRRRKSPVSVAVTLSIARQLAAALAYLRGVSDAGAGRPVRCDLRPANVLVSADGEHFVIAGLGLYRDALWSGSTLLGIAAYMAPEALIRNEASPASDMWGLGVILYELVTLRRPNFLEGREPAEVFVDGWRPDLSSVADGFIKGILERIFVLEPEKRLTAIELCGMLTTLDVSADELGHRYVVLEGRCSSLETALNSANARITALEAALDARSAEVASLKEDLEAKADRIDALEHQGKEHLAMIKALESRLAQSSSGMNAADPRSGLLLLPRLMRAAHTNSTEAVRVLLEEGTRTGQRDEQGMTGLMHAARQGHLGPVKLLAEKEKGLQDRNGWTALMHATHNNHSEVAEILAPHEHGKRNNSGQTALMIAVANSHAETARAIAAHEHGSRDPRGRTALMIAAQQGNLEVVKILLDHEKGMKDGSGCTALAHAARAGHRGVAELLMAHEKDAAGWTVLMCAAALGDTDLASRHLSERGQRDRRGLTALVLAAQNGRGEAVELLAKHEGGVSGWTGLIHSAYLGDAGAVEENLYEKGCTDITWASALMRAAQRGHKAAVEILLEHEKGMKDKDGDTAFMYALRNKHTDIALLLREHEAPSWTPLMCASFTGDIETVRRHLSERDRKNSDGETALVLAAREGYKEIIELLDPTDEDGVTALMRAAAKGDAEMVELLAPVQKGMRDKNGDTAFMHAFRNKHIDTAMLLQRYETHSWTPLMCAALVGDIEGVKKHILDKDTRNSEGDTALIIAARAGHEDIVEVLDPTDYNRVTALMRAADRNDLATARALAPLQAGQRASGSSNIDWCIRNGTALMRAAARGHAEVVELLLEKEGGMQTSDGRTALMIAAENNHSGCVRLLLEEEGGMETSGLFVNGKTALMSAAQSGHPDCVKLLLEREGGMKDSNGWTALMYAAENGHLDCVRLLVDRERDASGWTSLMCAAFLGDADAVRNNLQQAGMKDNYGQTALMWAARNGHSECVRLLVEKEGGMKNSSGWTALMKAICNNRIGCVRLLAEWERGINRGELLNIARRNGNREIMAILSK
ncbi:Kinase, NEK [Giardia lamblia P15]|uniref:Kinase, NEK n=1 Tax=Giardia intestinalis (strain P15) TaxID=658858 RepID=E1EVZ7_GIAIA|nr:Kinase, NEK [Giardia lamblia P15]